MKKLTSKGYKLYAFIMHYKVIFLIFILSLVVFLTVFLGDKKENGLICSYKLDKSVSDFPPVEDLSTPEAAYATIMRNYMAMGASPAEWSRIGTIKNSDTSRRSVSPEMKKNYLNAKIVEVRIYKKCLAQVIAIMTEDGLIGCDQRYLIFDAGKWLNAGQDDFVSTIKKARKTFAKKCEKIAQVRLKELGQKTASRWDRPSIHDPNTYLKPYVDFLEKEGFEPHGFIINAFKKYKLVTIGEAHNRPDYWNFNIKLVRDPAFVDLVGTIYLELPINHQKNIDLFLSQATCEREIVINILRDFTELGWPCQSTLDFFVAVWETNKKLSVDKKIRVRLVDMARPWEKISELNDWKKYKVDRDLFMAQNILDDLETEQGKTRHGLFIVGMAHAMEGLYYADQKTRRESAGMYLEQKLGEQLFTVFQHVPVMSNKGAINGRLALGLIDTAFEQLGNQPIAFNLRKSPFGKLPFDGMPDYNVYGNFSNGYDAYLFLLPLKNEYFSHLIQGFYSEEFTSEISRRYQIMRGRPIPENMSSSEKIIKMRTSFWGQPRRWIQQLGPLNAWHMGDNWKTKVRKTYYADVKSKDLEGQLDKIYDAVKKIDLQERSKWETMFRALYVTKTDWPGMYNWWREVAKIVPIESVQYGEFNRSKDGLPQIETTVLLQNGTSFTKRFSFEYNPLRGCWIAKYGLDLHLDKKYKNLSVSL